MQDDLIAQHTEDNQPNVLSLQLLEAPEDGDGFCISWSSSCQSFISNCC
jgi:hypothetical protein